ncbi:hypothetical protein [Synechococcus phage BUCT-ZZ01]|nr:hypothetical protein [Synechococcus phage BUCT-ZZ01]
MVIKYRNDMYQICAYRFFLGEIHARNYQNRAKILPTIP